MKFVFVLSVLVGLFGSAQAQQLVTKREQIGHRSFSRAKALLPAVYNRINNTFYCGCTYQDKEVNLTSCGYKVRKDAKRAARVEWEHVVPAWAIGHQRKCWQQGGRSNCSKTDSLYIKAEGDMHNLVPAIGEINNDRGNFGFSVWTRRPSTTYGSCQMHIDFKGRRAQPPEYARGRIARITFYMANEYKLRLSTQERRLYCIWAKTYPVDAWEKYRDDRIYAIQGNRNPFVSQPAWIERICQ